MAAARREASRQPAGGTSRASSSSSTSFRPRRDGGTPREIPSNGGGSDVSCVINEFGIGVRLTHLCTIHFNWTQQMSLTASAYTLYNVHMSLEFNWVLQ